MTVKELIEELSKHDPDAKVIGYDTYHQTDFWVRGVVDDDIVEDKYFDGFTKEYCLRSFYTSGVSAVNREPLGESVVVLC